MADPMRVRAAENGGIVDVKILMKHDMEAGQRKDAAGKVIGGSWITETRPDFLWMFQRSATFKNSPIPLGGLGKIYSPVRRR